MYILFTRHRPEKRDRPIDPENRRMSMKALQDRARAFENHYAYEEDFRFRAEARRNKLTALWAASLMAKPDPEAYSQNVVWEAMTAPDDKSVVVRLHKDLQQAGISVDEHDLQGKMAEILRDVVAHMKIA